MTYEAMADDVLGWLDEQEIDRAVVLGHSMGGKVAMLLACHHPERVAKLIAVDIAPRDYFWPAHRQSFAAMHELQLGDLRTRGEAELRFEARVPSLGMRKFLATNLEQRADGRWAWQINLPVLTAALPELERNPLGPGDRFEGPVQFLGGGKSNYIEPADHATIRAYFPNAWIGVIAEANHNPHMETRGVFVAKVLAFAI